MRNYIMFIITIVLFAACDEQTDLYYIVGDPCHTDWDCTTKQPECTEDGRLITYLDGYCENQSCMMDFTEQQCDISCIEADADTDPWEPDTAPAHCEQSCEGIICDTPWNDRCVSDDAMLSYNTEGAFCYDGMCIYQQAASHYCPDGCIEQEGDDICSGEEQ